MQQEKFVFLHKKNIFHYESGEVLNKVTQKGTEISFFFKIFRISQHRAILKYENRFLIKWLVFLVKLGHCILL